MRGALPRCRALLGCPSAMNASRERLGLQFSRSVNASLQSRRSLNGCFAAPGVHAPFRQAAFGRENRQTRKRNRSQTRKLTKAPSRSPAERSRSPVGKNASRDAKPAIRARTDTFGAAARSSYGGLKQPKPASYLLSQEVDASPLALPSAEPAPLLAGSAAPSAGGVASSFSACGRTGNVPHWDEGRREEHEAQHDS